MQKSPSAFRTISEVSEWLDTPAHVLRFWESKFTQINPLKRAGGRRYYRPSDMMLLGGIKKLLHGDGMTIKGVQKILSTQGVKAVAEQSIPFEEEQAVEGPAASVSIMSEPAAPEPVVEDTNTEEQPVSAPAPGDRVNRILERLSALSPQKAAELSGALQPLRQRLRALCDG